MALEPGYLVSKHVRLVRELKRGGMGSVWIADHLALQTQVAVKFMAALIADDAAAIARFAREATSAARIKSPHVVQVHDYGLTPDAVPFMVMELLQGEDLSTRLKREGAIPFEAAAQIVLQVCRVLGKAHQLGIVHRDIKPSNLFLLDADGEIFVKVLDFGVAKMGDDQTSELTTTGVLVGTVVYMSPEQLLNAKAVDHRADLWSLAVAAYQAMTRELPFKRDDGLGALCRAVEAGSFTRPSACVADIPPEVDAWFERAFEPRIEARFGSAKEMFDALQRAIGGAASPMSAPSSSLVPRSPRPFHEGSSAAALRPSPRAPANSTSTLPAAATILDLAAAERAASDAAEARPTTASSPRAEPKSQAAAAVHDGGSPGKPGSAPIPPVAEGGSPGKPASAPPIPPPQTLGGTASLHPPSRRTGRPIARLLGIAAALGALAGGAAFARSRGLLPLGRWLPGERATPVSAAVHAPEPASSPGAAAPAVMPAMAVTMGGAPASPPAQPATIPAASITRPTGPSAAPPPVAGAKARSQRGGARSGVPEKDYGF